MYMVSSRSHITDKDTRKITITAPSAQLVRLIRDNYGNDDGRSYWQDQPFSFSARMAPDLSV